MFMFCILIDCGEARSKWLQFGRTGDATVRKRYGRVAVSFLFLKHVSAAI